MQELPLPKGFTYTLPNDSVPKKKEPRAGQKEPDSLLCVEYWLNDDKVGERTWDAGKRFRSEILFRNGLVDGIMQTWSADGKPVRAVPFREGKVHGPLKDWSASGDTKTIFWIEGRQVSQEAFEKYSAEMAGWQGQTFKFQFTGWQGHGWQGQTFKFQFTGASQLLGVRELKFESLTLIQEIEI